MEPCKSAFCPAAGKVIMEGVFLVFLSVLLSGAQLLFSGTAGGRRARNQINTFQAGNFHSSSHWVFQK